MKRSNLAFVYLSLSLTGSFATAANLVVNGDFTTATPAASQYSYAPNTPACFQPNPARMNEGCYSIVTDPSQVHNNFASFGDHTTGTGNMLVANGAASADYVWQQTVTGVVPSTKYGISAWAATALPNDPAPANLRIEVDVSGACGGTSFTAVGTINAPTAAGVWTQSKGTFLSGASTSVCVRLLNQNTAANGNDFALDDIAVDSALVAGSPTAAADSGTTPLNTPITINVLQNDTAGNAGIDATTLDLDPGTPGVQTTFTDPGKGTYTVVAGGVQFTPVAGFVGTSVANYRVAANDGSPSNVAGITVTVAGGTLASVPTLSQWATGMLAALLALAGLRQIRRRSRVSK